MCDFLFLKPVRADQYLNLIVRRKLSAENLKVSSSGSEPATPWPGRDALPLSLFTTAPLLAGVFPQAAPI